MEKKTYLIVITTQMSQSHSYALLILLIGCAHKIKQILQHAAMHLILEAFQCFLNTILMPKLFVEPKHKTRKREKNAEVPLMLAQ